jgi:formate/nitrite transporter FocA (FNT family)
MEALSLAVPVGAIFGVLYLANFIDSKTTLIGGAATGIGFCVIVFTTQYLFGDSTGLKGILVFSVAGAVGGVIWWLTTQPSIHIGIAAVLGSGFAALLGWSEGAYKKRRRNQYIDGPE